MCEAMMTLMKDEVEKSKNEAVIEAQSETARALWNDGIHDFDKLIRLTCLSFDQLKVALAAYLV